MKNKKLITGVAVVGVAGIGAFLLYQNRQAIADMINKISEAGGVGGGEEGSGGAGYGYQPANTYNIYSGTPTGESGVGETTGGTGVGDTTGGIGVSEQPQSVGQIIKEGLLLGAGWSVAGAGAKVLGTGAKYVYNKATGRAKELGEAEKGIGEKAGAENKLRIDEKVKSSGEIKGNVKGGYEGTNIKVEEFKEIKGFTEKGIIFKESKLATFGKVAGKVGKVAGRVFVPIGLALSGYGAYEKYQEYTEATARAGVKPTFKESLGYATASVISSEKEGITSIAELFGIKKKEKVKKEKEELTTGNVGTDIKTYLLGQQTYSQPRILNKSVVQNVQAQVQATQQNVVTTSTGYSSSSANVKKASVTVTPITQIQKTTALKTATAVGSTKFQALAKKTLGGK